MLGRRDENSPEEDQADRNEEEEEVQYSSDVRGMVASWWSFSKLTPPL